IVDTVPTVLSVTKTVLPSGVTATANGVPPTGMSAGSLVPVFTSIVDTEPLKTLGTKTVLPSGVTAGLAGTEPAAMSSGLLTLVFTPILDTVPLMPLVTKAVARHRPSGAAADTPSGSTPASAPANPTTPTPRPH